MKWKGRLMTKGIFLVRKRAEGTNLSYFFCPMSSLQHIKLKKARTKPNCIVELSNQYHSLLLRYSITDMFKKAINKEKFHCCIKSILFFASQLLNHRYVKTVV